MPWTEIQFEIPCVVLYVPIVFRHSLHASAVGMWLISAPGTLSQINVMRAPIPQMNVMRALKPQIDVMRAVMLQYHLYFACLLKVNVMIFYFLANDRSHDF